MPRAILMLSPQWEIMGQMLVAWVNCLLRTFTDFLKYEPASFLDWAGFLCWGLNAKFQSASSCSTMFLYAGFYCTLSKWVEVKGDRISSFHFLEKHEVTAPFHRDFLISKILQEKLQVMLRLQDASCWMGWEISNQDRLVHVFRVCVNLKALILAF